jgi:alanyl-tRNA synthetase
MSALMKSVFEKVSGKGGGLRDFTRGKLADPARAKEAVDAARAILDENRSKEAAS